MFKSLQRSWLRFRDAPPGERFIRHYRHRQSGSKSKASTVAFVVLGLALIGVGAVALVAPGPGILIIALGAALVAQESEVASKQLDRFELWVRRQVSAFRRWWGKASLPARVAVVTVSSVVGFAAAAAFGYFVLRQLW